MEQRHGVGTLIIVALITVVVIFPIYWMIVTSILPTSTVLSRNPPLFPPLDQLSIKAYSDVLALKPVFTWMFNSIVIAAGSIAISLTVSVMAGYSLSRFKTRAQQAAGVTLLVSKMLPSTLIVIPFFVMFSSFKMINSPIALMLANASVGVPFATWMMKGFFDSIPRELEEAAMVDGCTPFTALLRIILPLARPGVSAAAIYLAIVTWSDLVFARTLMQDSTKWTLPVGLSSFVGEYQVEWANLMAAGAISLIPVVILFIILEPFLVSGLTQGGVKE
ncbi:MAG TPA: carbohydrate ABC transporter permease [Devosia sp.]|nr:carbohydrate ABC transporter permease [Devosia sp.]